MSTDNLPTAPRKVEVVTSDSGVLLPRNFDEAWRLADMYKQSGILPKAYDTTQKVMTGMQYALELGLKPLTSLSKIAVIHGTPSVFGDLPLSLAQSKGLVESIDEYWIDKDGKKICAANNNLTAEVFAAVCIMKRKGDPIPIETFFTKDEANKAGLFKNAVWTSYTKRMLRYRARSQALKDKFPDALNGLAIAEYDHNYLPEAGDENTIDIEVTQPELTPSQEKLQAAKADEKTGIIEQLCARERLVNRREISNTALRSLGVAELKVELLEKVPIERLATTLKFLNEAKLASEITTTMQ